jgi:hypothetical protein
VRTVLLTGDREWDDVPTVVRALRELAPGDRVLVGDDGITRPHGRTRGEGLDSIAYRVALTWVDGLRVDPPYVANWTKLGLNAGPIRNRTMLDQRPDEVWAFHDDLANSRGTRDCVNEALRRGIRVRYFHTGGDASPSAPGT